MGKLKIEDSATTPPLNVTERSAEPSSPIAGDIYLDDGTNTASAVPGWRHYTGSAWEDVSATVSGSGISNVVEDTTPQLGGQLDVNGQAIGDGTRELLTFTEDGSAVNHVNIENEAAGNGPIISSAGDDTNIDLHVTPKGTGDVYLNTDTVLVEADITHIGDTNNKIAFGTDTQSFETGGTARIDLTDSGVRLGATGARVTSITDSDSLGTSDTILCTQGNVKAYVDGSSNVGGYRTVFVGAGAMIPRSTNGAASGTLELATNDIMLDVMDFDTSTEEGVGFWLGLPLEWNAGVIKVKFFWTAASGSGTVKWDIAARAYANDDAIDQALGTEQTASADTLIAANDMHITAATPDLTIGGTAVAGEPIYFQIARDVAGDNLGVDARLIGCMIQYTESTTEPSAW